MSDSRVKIEVAVTILTHGILNIPFIVTTSVGSILYMTHISKIGSDYKIRQDIINKINELQREFSIDTIIMEQNKLFLDKIDKYPDPYVLRNVTLGYGIQTSIEDNFFTSLNLISLPEYEWKNTVLNKRARYAIDLYKAHVLHRTSIPKQQLLDIDKYNYYEAVCLSESILFDSLMSKKHQINRGELKVEKR